MAIVEAALLLHAASRYAIPICTALPQVENTMAHLRWVSGDNTELFVDIDDFDTRAEASEVIPGVLAEMLRNCTSESECATVRAGSFYIDDVRVKIGETLATDGQTDTSTGPSV